MKRARCTCLRSRVIEFLIRSSQLLEVSPIVKYSALSLFADRFYPALSRLKDRKVTKNWLLHPIEECNLQLFALVSLWISSKVHDSPPLSVKKFKSLGDKFIKEQHYTMGDILEAEIVLMQVVQFGIGMSKITFSSVEDLLVQFKAIAQVGEHVKFEACMDVMDLLYENEETSVLYSSPEALAASVVVVGYIITVPPQRWEFPVLPWVKFVTSCKEEDILDTVRVILKHIFEPQADYYVANE
ncbi:cyclin-J18 isoform X1 [Salvia hispanica]|uniref:cyclin-J18 isoform X1 n=1 Tax=Salvia hispanica TaxID=49212 RepID=UPI002009149D|nr:cyclin-J18 isoform X1 [Salvia hispanica]XP_047959629.1 cyclin-J18 isoform X1 [Salvia hispanica]